MQRNLSADILKTIAIFGVVFIHGSWLLGGTSEISQAFVWLFRFCVPAFIIMWAYFFELSYSKRDKVGQRKYIFSRFKHIFIVFMIWSLIYFFKLADWETLTFKDVITKHFSGYGFAGQYFFIILFQLMIFYPLIRWCYEQKILRYVIIAGIIALYFIWGYGSQYLPSALLKLGDRPFIFWIPYVFAGISLARNQLPRLSIWLGLIVFLIPVESYFLQNVSPEHPAYITPVVLAGSFLLTTIALQRHLESKQSKGSTLLSFTGGNTMTAFVANPILIMGLSLIIDPIRIRETNQLFNCTLPFISAAIIYFTCLLLAGLINKTKLRGILN